MKADPLETALREVTDTKRLLEALVAASESFDYLRAKATLDELRLKIKTLTRTQEVLMDQRGAIPGCVIPFPQPTRHSN